MRLVYNRTDYVVIVALKTARYYKLIALFWEYWATERTVRTHLQINCIPHITRYEEIIVEVYYMSYILSDLKWKCILYIRLSADYSIIVLIRSSVYAIRCILYRNFLVKYLDGAVATWVPIYQSNILSTVIHALIHINDMIVHLYLCNLKSLT